MSKYTTEVRYLCEVEYGATESLGFNSINDVITTAAPKVFNFDFPMFDEAYRLPLEIKILRHYYTREICEESVGLWKLRLQDRLNMIMPYYNQLYSSELIQFNPMYDVDLTKESTKDNDGEKTNNETNLDTTYQNNVSESNTTNTGTNSTTTANTTVNSNTSSETSNDTANTTSTSNESGSNNSTRNNVNEKLDKYSDTPQGSVVNLENDTYLTNARIISDNANETNSGSSSANISSTGNSSNSGTRSGETNGNETFSGSSDNSYSSNNVNSSSSTDNKTVNKTKIHTGTMTNSEEYFEHLIGKTGKNSNSKLLTEFRETFLNIDKMIIEELSDLFFGLWE